MKTYKYIIAVIGSALLLASCNSALDIKQDNKLSASNMWEDANDVTTSTRGIYHRLRTNFMNRYTSTFYWAEVRVGEYMWKRPTLTDISTKVCTDLLYNTMNTSNDANSWTRLYAAIDQANSVLKYAEQVTMTQKEKEYALGQAYFARAFSYFWAVRVWGDVPLVTVPIESPSQDETYPSRAPKADVYAQIEKDLDEASKYVANLGTNKYYATKDALNMLIAEEALWMYSVENGGSSYLTRAQTALEAIGISSNNLLADYSSIFSITNKLNKEIVFAINNKQADGNTGAAFYQNMWPYYSDVKPEFYSNPVLISGYFLIFSDSFVNMIEESKSTNGDIRTDCIMGKGNYGTNGGEIIWANKYKPAMTPGDQTYIHELDLLYYRYAQAVMMYAELKYYQQDYEGANAALNLIAKRAYNKDNFYSTNTKAAVLEALQKEYTIEFAEEGVIWWALIRLGKIFEANPTLATYKTTNPNILYFPIAQSALNLNQNLEQTQGWGK